MKRISLGRGVDDGRDCSIEEFAKGAIRCGEITEWVDEQRESFDTGFGMLISWSTSDFD